MLTPLEIKKCYQNGDNISELLRQNWNLVQNTPGVIEISYDMQAGTYVEEILTNQDFATHQKLYTEEISKIITSLCKPTSILEAGVGEATTLSGVLQHLGNDVAGYGFDISWSRVAYAKNWLCENNLDKSVLCTGDLFNIPFCSNSIDVVYTSHSIEPNGGNEKPILSELYRVAKKYLILLEPGYELSNATAQKRMDSHGYCKNIAGFSKSLGFDVVEHVLFPHSMNPLNPTALTIIRKGDKHENSTSVLACPKFKTPLKKLGDMFFSNDALVVYPVVAGIPCLRIENGIFASKYQEVIYNK